MSGIDANTKLLLHLSGGHGATSFPDRSASANAVTAVGGAAVTTAISGPFGSAPGVLYCDGAGDYLSVADTDALNLGTGNFGLDFWFRDDFSAASFPAIVATQIGWTTGGFGVRFNNSGQPGKISLHWYGVGGPVLTSATLTVRVWHHVLVQRSGAVLALFVDGVLQGTATTPATNTAEPLDLCAGGAFLVGGSGDGANGYFKGHVAELRVVKGAAPTTVATDPLHIPSGVLADGFTPPTVPYSSVTRAVGLRGLAGVAATRGVSGRGLHGVRRLFHAAPRGLSGVAAERLSALRGLSRVLRTYRHDGRGLSRVLLTFHGGLRGQSRVANTGLDRYELYRGVDATADTAGAPWETFSAIPHETGAMEPGHAYQFVLRRRNAFGLVSENIDAWSVELDGDGEVLAPDPSPPESFSAVATSGLRVRVSASYLSVEDGGEPATHWAVYIAVGADPDPEVDTPVLVPLAFVGSLAALNWTSGAFADGAEVRVLVRLRRVVDGGFGESRNATPVSVTVTSAGPAGTVPGAFFGYAAKQGAK